MDLTAVFTADSGLKVLHGCTEVGSVSPVSLTATLPEGQPRVLALAGRAWVVTHVDWRRRVVSVAPSEGRGRSRWGRGGMGLGREMTQSMRAVLLGEDPGVPLSKRGHAALTRLRDERAGTVHPDGTVLVRDGAGSRWWTYAGSTVNASLAAALAVGGAEATLDAFGVTLAGDLGASDAGTVLRTARSHLGALPAVTAEVRRV